MVHQSTDHCVWNCLESVRGAPYELSSNTDYDDSIGLTIHDSLFEK